MARAIVVNDVITIPGAELTVTYARSAGPGGQNVNKLNTKAVLRWQVVASPSLSAGVRKRFLDRFGNRVNNEGELVLAADEHREQARNLTACRERLRQMLLSVATPPRRRLKTRPPRSAVEKRIRSKQQQSEKKSRRGPLGDGE